MFSVSRSLQERRLRLVAEAASMLYQAGARRVWAFGSLARGEMRDLCSDFDFAVEGLADEQIYRLRYTLRGLLRAKVDVVSMERALPQLREGILKCRVQFQNGQLGRINTLCSIRRSRPRWWRRSRASTSCVCRRYARLSRSTAHDLSRSRLRSRPPSGKAGRESPFRTPLGGRSFGDGPE